jgi:hypothetical protein
LGLRLSVLVLGVGLLTTLDDAGVLEFRFIKRAKFRICWMFCAFTITTVLGVGASLMGWVAAATRCTYIKVAVICWVIEIKTALALRHIRARIRALCGVVSIEDIYPVIKKVFMPFVYRYLKFVYINSLTRVIGGMSG